MAQVIDYATALEALTGQGFKSLYYNSGAFGFVDRAGVGYVGWIGGEDATLRAEMRALARGVAAPYSATLSNLAAMVWAEEFEGAAWVMPMSHWAYEMDFGSREWMPAAVEKVGVEARELAGLTTGNPLQFLPSERKTFADFVKTLLENLRGSDFGILFPGRPVIGTVHHHGQLWWTSNDSALLKKLRDYVK